MTIYKLEQVTLSDGRVGSFDLPATIGHYTSREKAEAKIARILADWSAGIGAGDWTTESDYRVTPIGVE